MRARRAMGFVIAVTALVLPAPAAAQWQSGDLAVKTSGAVLRPGDPLKVELVALSGIPGPFSTQVTYRFNERVTVREKDEPDRTELRARQAVRPPGAVFDYLDPLATLVVDDTFYFGQASLDGRYDVEVRVLAGAGGDLLATIRSCVVFQGPDAAGPTAAGNGCPLLLRGIQRVTSPGWITFDGNFPSSGRYTAVLMREGRVVGVIDTGMAVTSPHDLDVISPVLAALAGQTVDLVLHNHDLNATTTLARVVVPEGR